MTNLPFTLPTCDQPATARIEVYTPAPDGSGSSLDAAVYTCEQHTSPALTTIRAAGLNAYPTPLAPEFTRGCGDVHTFATGNLGRPEHPTWCDRKGCAERAEHRSVPMGVKPSPQDLTTVTVQLVQLTAAPGTPVLVGLTFHAEDPDDTVEHLVTLDQAVALTYRIRGLADRAKGRRR